MILAGTALLVATTVYGIEGTQSAPPQPAEKPIPFTVRAPVAHVLYSIPMPLNGLMILSLPLGKSVAATATPPSPLSSLLPGSILISASRPIPWPVRIYRSA